MKRYLKAVVAVLLLFTIFSGCTNGKVVNTVDVTTALTAAQTTTQASTEAVSVYTTASSSSDATKKSDEVTKKATVSQTKSDSTTKVTQKMSNTTISTDGYCTIIISCKTIANNRDKLKASKTAFVPSDYQILKETKVQLKKNDMVFDILKRVCKENQCSDHCAYCQKNGIQLEYTYTPAYESYYIEGVHQIYEKDCGTKSGWVYKVNGEVSNIGCNKRSVKNGDKIEWLYTCSSGEDVY